MQAGTFGEVWDIGAQVPSPNRLEAAPRLNMGAKNSHVSLSQMVLGVKNGYQTVDPVLPFNLMDLPSYI